jgi:hypothetical protein
MKSNYCCFFLLTCLLIVTSTPLYPQLVPSATGVPPAEKDKRESELPPLISLQESKIVQIPTEYRFSDTQCDADGRVYAYFRPTDAKFNAVRFSLDLQPEQVFSLPKTGELNNYSFSEFAPSPSGGLVVVGNPNRSDMPQVLVRFDAKGRFKDAVPLRTGSRALEPERFAFFPDGTLLAVDVRRYGYVSETSKHWLAAILKDDGTVIQKLSLETSSFFSELVDSGNSEIPTGSPSVELGTVDKRQLQLYPSSNGNVYAVVPLWRSGNRGKLRSRLAEISPSGVVTYYAFPSTGGQELLHLAVNGNRVFAVFGSDAGQGDVDSFLIDGSSHRLDLVARYTMIGPLLPSGRNGELLPVGATLQCATENGLIATQPDPDPESGANDFAIYKIPSSK